MIPSVSVGWARVWDSAGAVKSQRVSRRASGRSVVARHRTACRPTQGSQGLPLASWLREEVDHIAACGPPGMTCHAVMVTSLPPGPTAGPALQTMRWLVRPIAFLEACRRRYGDAFSVRFLGFETPLVMVSKPEVLRALYSESGHGLPPGRTLSLRPITGPRSVLLLDGAEHLSRRRVMLPPFHGDRMRCLRADRPRGSRTRDRALAD